MTSNREVQGEPEPCRCHEHLRKMLGNHPGHCCFRSPRATCHAAEVAEWETRYEVANGRSPRVVLPHEMDGNFVG